MKHEAWGWGGAAARGNCMGEDPEVGPSFMCLRNQKMVKGREDGGQGQIPWGSHKNSTAGQYSVYTCEGGSGVGGQRSRQGRGPAKGWQKMDVEMLGCILKRELLGLVQY